MANATRFFPVPFARCVVQGCPPGDGPSSSAGGAPWRAPVHAGGPSRWPMLWPPPTVAVLSGRERAPPRRRRGGRRDLGSARQAGCYLPRRASVAHRCRGARRLGCHPGPLRDGPVDRVERVCAAAGVALRPAAQRGWTRREPPTVPHVPERTRPQRQHRESQGAARGSSTPGAPVPLLVARRLRLRATRSESSAPRVLAEVVPRAAEPARHTWIRGGRRCHLPTRLRRT